MGSRSSNTHIIELSSRDKLLKLHLVPLDSLKPHEKHLNSLLQYLHNAMINDKILRDPLLADCKRGLIIDGTHRALILKKIGVDYVPVQDIDYLDPRLMLYRWFRIYRDEDVNIEEIFKDFVLVKDFEIGDLDNYSLYIVYKGKIFVLIDDGDLCKISQFVEEAMNKFYIHLKVEPQYISEDEILNGPFISSKDIVLGYRRILKNEVLKTHSKGLLLHNKATRHVPPHRILGINIPIDLLYRDKVQEALEYLNSLRLKYVGERVVIDGRYYAERIFKGIGKDQDYS